MKKYYTIGETAALLGVTTQTLRYYDKIGLLSPAYCDENTGYRYYVYKQFHYIDRIKYLQGFGMQLKDIKEIIHSGRVYPLIAAAVGPYGAYLADGSEYRGDYNISVEELKKFHKKRMELLWNAGAEILAVETIPSLTEALAVAEIVEEIGAECWISFSCKNETEISDGTPIRECAKKLNGISCVKAIGLNCTAPHFVESLIKEIKKETDKPVLVYPNSGEIYDAETKTWHGAKDGKTYGQWAEIWYKAGVGVIGGCCRTTPANIKEVYDIVRK